MEIADLILPVFAVIVTGWVAGWSGFLPRDLANALIQFAYNVAMPALLIVTIAQEPAGALANWRFLLAFGGGSMLCFVLVFGVLRLRREGSLASQTIRGMAASMTNTGFVALPVLKAVYGAPAVLPAAIATVFVAVVMFPIAVVLLEYGRDDGRGGRRDPFRLVWQVAVNPMVSSTVLGMLWSALGLGMPAGIGAYLAILADALTPCALFAIGLGLSVQGLRASAGTAAWLTAVKLVVMPAIVCALSRLVDLGPLDTAAAVVCAAVPTAKTMYILAGRFHCEEALVASTVSMTTLCSIASLIAWLYAFSAAGL
jgi:predicted permease